MEATTIRTAVADLVKGDTVFMHSGPDRIVMDSTTDQYGTWIVWDDGERDSYPPAYKVYRVENA
jgi:hypothetical protein